MNIYLYIIVHNSKKYLLDFNILYILQDILTVLSFTLNFDATIYPNYKTINFKID